MRIAHNMLGCRFDNWLRLRKQNPITDKPERRLITAASLALYLPALLERRLYAKPIMNSKVEKGPVYIVGFWRSGTTYLQNILTRDPQFGWFDPVTTLMFSNCIMLGRALKWPLKAVLPDARPMDNLDYALDMPMEELFGLATISTQTISHMLVFPDGGNGRKYIESAFIDEQGEEDLAKWRKAYDYVLRKGTYRCKGKELLLKSPENTCRIAELKRCYPNAKFINIYRNPYKVIQSSVHMFSKEMELLALNEPASTDTMEDIAIDLFCRTYRKAVPELDAMADCDHVDVCYETFCKDPMADLERIYWQLGLDGFGEAKPYFEKYIESQEGYQKNKFVMGGELRKKINSKVGFYMDKYGYEMVVG